MVRNSGWLAAPSLIIVILHILKTQYIKNKAAIKQSCFFQLAFYFSSFLRQTTAGSAGSTAGDLLKSSAETNTRARIKIF